MALANGDKAAVCSVIVAVAVVLGLIAYGPYYTKGVAELPSPSNSNSASAVGETNAAAADVIATPAAQNAAAATTAAATTPVAQTTTESKTAEKESADVSDALSIADVVNATVVTGSANPDAAAEPETIPPALPVLDCSVPSSVPQDSQMGWSSILLDPGLQPLAGKTVS